MIILYTTTEAIRATLGIDVNDTPDELINNRNFELLLLERLDVILPNHEDASDADESVLRRLTLWSQYYCALELIRDATLGIPAKIQANTDSVQRFNIDFKALEINLANRVATLEAALNPAMFGLSIAPSLMGLAKPDYDPITGA